MLTKFTNCCRPEYETELRECRISNAELRLEPFVNNGIERRRYVKPNEYGGTSVVR